MPSLSVNDKILLYVSTLNAAGIAALPAARYASFPLVDLMEQAVSDRLTLAGVELGDGDLLLQQGNFRSSISRHYYAMYHAARAIIFAFHRGDDHEAHSRLPRNLPTDWVNVASRESQLTDARLLRNQADYDSYPTNPRDWGFDARHIATESSDFVSACEDYALQKGFV